MRAASGWYRQWKASISTRPARSAASAMRSASSAFEASGFSQSTCLPASRARMVHSQWSPLGSGL